MTSTLPTLHCRRCGHHWHPRMPEPPIQCPRCKSRVWQKPPRQAPPPQQAGPTPQEATSNDR